MSDVIPEELNEEVPDSLVNNSCSIGTGIINSFQAEETKTHQLGTGETDQATLVRT